MFARKRRPLTVFKTNNSTPTGIFHGNPIKIIIFQKIVKTPTNVVLM